jgi:hypothetical protein
MPSNRIAGEIERSLAPGENFADFAYLFDTLMLLRQPYHQDLNLSEKVAGRLLCVLFPDKPAKYVGAMREFRLRFADVSNNRELQAEFPNRVRPAAILISRPEDMVWRPSLYFSRSLRFRNLREWF